MRSGADVNGDNLWIYRAYLQISDYCRVTVRVRNMVRVSVGAADCCIQTARKSEKNADQSCDQNRPMAIHPADRPPLGILWCVPKIFYICMARRNNK